MTNDTTLLVGLEGLACQKVELDDDQGPPVAHLITADAQAARCPACAVMSTCPKGL